MKDSIIDNEKVCFICRTTENLDPHHVFRGEGKRKFADEDGCYIWLCRYHHTMSDEAVHNNTPFRRTLEKYAQHLWEEKNGTREDFRKRYGKSFL